MFRLSRASAVNAMRLKIHEYGALRRPEEVTVGSPGDFRDHIRLSDCAYRSC
jgi:hypothetical protein